MHRFATLGIAVATCMGIACGSSPGTDTDDSASTGTTGSSTTQPVTPTTSGTSEGLPSTGDPSEDPSSTGDEPVVCGDDVAPAQPIAWDRGQPDISGCTVRGQRDYRAMIHLHSHHSHDACDGEPQPGGIPDESCLQDLRDALCITRTDVAFMTDHPAHATSATLEELLLVRGDDEIVLNAEGQPIANWLQCGNGHRTLIIPGIESSKMMPLGLERHVEDAYGESSPQSFQQIRDAGALAWVAHTEGRDPAELATLGLDGIEFYQLHANLDPDIRKDHLDLDPGGFITDITPFFFGGDNGLQPDLATLGFVLPNEPSIRTLEQLGQTQRLTISAGTDAHQNVIPSKAADGERVDSYRRMIRWFNNRLRLDVPLTPESAKAALRTGRNHIVFESFGTPQGFDFYAQQGEVITEMGAEVNFAAGLTLFAALPHLDLRSPHGDNAPSFEGRLYRATGDNRELLQTWTDGTSTLEVPGPGVYRVEVWITPSHLAPYLGEMADNYIHKTLPWVYSAALFVR